MHSAHACWGGVGERTQGWDLPGLAAAAGCAQAGRAAYSRLAGWLAAENLCFRTPSYRPTTPPHPTHPPITLTPSNPITLNLLSNPPPAQLIYNFPEELFADAGVMAIEHADFDGIERLALVTGGCRRRCGGTGGRRRQERGQWWES